MTVYLFMPDAQGAPTCTDACAQSWPPVVVEDGTEVTGGEGVDASLLGTVDHPDAGTQATYNGWPLYVFSGDSTAGRHQRSGSRRRVVRARPDRQPDRQRPLATLDMVSR